MNYQEIYNKIQNNEYKAKAPFVKRLSLKHLVPTDSEILEFMKGEGKDCSYSNCKAALEARKEIEFKKSKKANDLYNQQERDGYNQFKSDLADAFNLKNSPWFEPIFTSAWENGHASGYSEVLNYFSDLVENFSNLICNYNLGKK